MTASPWSGAVIGAIVGLAIVSGIEKDATQDRDVHESDERSDGD